MKKKPNSIDFDKAIFLHVISVRLYFLAYFNIFHTTECLLIPFQGSYSRYFAFLQVWFQGKRFKYFNQLYIGLQIFQKKTYPLHQQYKRDNAQVFLYFLFWDVFIIKRNEVSSVSMKRQEIRSSWQDAKLKYSVMEHDCVLLIKSLSRR